MLAEVHFDIIDFTLTVYTSANCLHITSVSLDYYHHWLAFWKDWLSDVSFLSVEKRMIKGQLNRLRNGVSNLPNLIQYIHI